MLKMMMSKIFTTVVALSAATPTFAFETPIFCLGDSQADVLRFTSTENGLKPLALFGEYSLFGSLETQHWLLITFVEDEGQYCVMSFGEDIAIFQ